MQHFQETIISKTILKRNFIFPTTSRGFERAVRRGQSMLILPDQMNEKEINDFVYTTMCSFGTHTHDKSITRRCHKNPKGINQCALTKPSYIIVKTKPIHLLGLMKPQAMTSEKVTISCEVSDKLQNHQSAIDFLPMTQHETLFRNNDPRLIAYEPKHSMILLLPEQRENATKFWIICQCNISRTMNNIANISDISSENNICKERQKSIIQMETSNFWKVI